MILVTYRDLTVKTFLMVTFGISLSSCKTNRIPSSVSNFLLATFLTAIIINEKLTRGEKWFRLHYAVLLLAMFVYAIVFFIAL